MKGIKGFQKGHPKFYFGPYKGKGMLGKNHSTITKEKLSLSTKKQWKDGKCKGFRKGKDNPHWKHGKYVNLFKSLREKERLAGRKKPEQCEVCGAIGKICFDHDHKTGKFRGWICDRCNLILGLSKDNSELLERLIEYIINY